MSFDTSSAFQSVHTEREFDLLRPWWDLFSSYVADSMVVVALLAVSLQVFGGLGSGVKCVPVFDPSEPKLAVSYAQRGFVDANCAEDGLPYMAQYLGYIVMLLIWILMAIDNFWTKWSRTRVVLKSFVDIARECHSSPCKSETVLRQLNTSLGKFDELNWDKEHVTWIKNRRGNRAPLRHFKQTKLSATDIQSAILLSQKTTEFLCQTAGTFTLFGVYKAKSWLKVMTSLVFAGLMFVRRFAYDDFRFEFNCGEDNFNMTLQFHKDGDSSARDILDFVQFTCNFNVGPFLDIIVSVFATQLTLYALFSICGLAGWQGLDIPLNEVKKEYKETKAVELAEERLAKITMDTDIKLLLYLLRYANHSYYESLRDFLSPCFQGYLVSLATNRKWDEGNLQSKMTQVEDDDVKGWSMNLADMDLREIPRSIFTMVEVQQLVALDLSYNEDVHSVAGIEKLKNLKNLDLEGCGLTKIDEVFQLTSLLMLDVMHNQITDIPEAIDNLIHLQQLKIKGNLNLNLHKCVNDMQSLNILICEKKIIRLIDPEFSVWADRKDYVQVYERRTQKITEE